MNLHDQSKPKIYWGFRVLLAVVSACIPALITAYFSYKSAALEASATKIRAEASYSEMVKHVEEMQTAIKELQAESDSQQRYC